MNEYPQVMKCKKAVSYRGTNFPFGKWIIVFQKWLPNYEMLDIKEKTIIV
jgi:hypothetical protein